MILKKIKDFIFFPVRVTLPNEWAQALGLTSMRQERIMAVNKHLQGRVLDIGCGSNELIKEYKNGIGVDVYPWDGIDLLCDTANLPLKSDSFDCCTFLANLNHIPAQYRIAVLNETFRVLKKEGLAIVTMINPILGIFGHLTLWRWWDPDQKVSGIKEGEEFGLWTEKVIDLFDKTGFSLIARKKFVYGLNNIYIFKKG